MRGADFASSFAGAGFAGLSAPSRVGAAKPFTFAGGGAGGAGGATGCGGAVTAREGAEGSSARGAATASMRGA
jgi:hypothetical protein